MALSSWLLAASGIASLAGNGTGEAPGDYILGPEDAVAINVVGQSDFSGTAVVRPDGKISAPGVGEIVAAGKSVATIREMVQQRVSEWIKNPIVTVGVTQFRSLGMIFVLGQVNRPGPYPYRPGLTATDALALAGGALLDADLRRANVVRLDHSKTEIDLSFSGSDGSRAEKGEAGERVPLVAGETLVIPQRARLRASVLGEVTKPGDYDITEKSTVLDLIRLADNPRPGANLKAATLQRDGETRKLDLEALLRRGDASVNCRIKDGDAIFIPENRIKVYVIGEVSKSDTYHLADGDTLLDALTAAGGTTREADLKRVRLGRPGPGGATEVQTLDLTRLVATERALTPPVLHDGDMLLVPSKGKKKSVTDYLPLLYPVELLSRLLR